MRLTGRTVSIFLSEEGRLSLQFADLNLADSPALLAPVQDTDDIGIWVRVKRQDRDHILLVRWEYVLSIEFRRSKAKVLGS